MYKVCFVDDETINYELFEKLVPWEEKGFTIAGTAADGLEALQMYERVQPDLIFMDIQLPRMDGLECVRCIREENKEVQIVIVSAYSDFSYAQKAIRYGVQDFLLKPVSRMMLNQQVDKIRNTLDSRRQPERKWDVCSNPYTEEMAQVLGCISQPLEDGTIPVRRLNELKAMCHLVLKPLSGEGVPAAGKNNATEDLAVGPAVKSAEVPSELERDAVISRGLAMIFTHSGTSLYLGYKDVVPDASVSERLIGYFKENGRAAELYLWENGQAPSLLSDFLERSATSDNHGFYEKYGGVYRYEEYPFQDIEINTGALDNLIVTTFSENTPDKLLDYVTGQFIKARNEHISPRLLKNFALDVLLKIKFCLKRLAPEESFYLMRNLRMEKIYDTVSSESLESFLRRRIEDAFRELEHSRILTDKGESVVFRANSFAQLHYCDPGFSVQKAAEFIGISKNYFTSLYKEKSGLGYWDYVTRLRLQKAMELLASTEDTVGAIAREIGYESEYHFSRKFKELTGQSPNRYRRQS